MFCVYDSSIRVREKTINLNSILFRYFNVVNRKEELFMRVVFDTTYLATQWAEVAVYDVLNEERGEGLVVKV